MLPMHPCSTPYMQCHPFIPESHLCSTCMELAIEGFGYHRCVNATSNASLPKHTRLTCSMVHCQGRCLLFLLHMHVGDMSWHSQAVTVSAVGGVGELGAHAPAADLFLCSASAPATSLLGELALSRASKPPTCHAFVSVSHRCWSQVCHRPPFSGCTGCTIRLAALH